MISQKKKIQIALTLLFTLGSSWGYHTAMVVEELTLASGDDELRKALENDPTFLRCLDKESDKDGPCHKILNDPHICDGSKNDNISILAKTKSSGNGNYCCGCAKVDSSVQVGSQGVGEENKKDNGGKIKKNKKNDDNSVDKFHTDKAERSLLNSVVISNLIKRYNKGEDSKIDYKNLKKYEDQMLKEMDKQIRKKNP